MINMNTQLLQMAQKNDRYHKCQEEHLFWKNQLVMAWWRGSLVTNFSSQNKIFKQENESENVVCQIAATLPRPQCIDTQAQMDLSPWL